MAIYETKIADHIIQGPHVQLANPVRNVAANPVHKSGGCYPAMVVLQYWNPSRTTNPVHKSCSQCANPVRKPGGCYLAEIAPRIADKSIA